SDQPDEELGAESRAGREALDVVEHAEHQRRGVRHEQLEPSGLDRPDREAREHGQPTEVRHRRPVGLQRARAVDDPQPDRHPPAAASPPTSAPTAPATYAKASDERTIRRYRRVRNAGPSLGRKPSRILAAWSWARRGASASSASRTVTHAPPVANRGAARTPR